MEAANENLRINQVVMHEVGAAARARPCELSLSHAASVRAVKLQVLPVEASWGWCTSRSHFVPRAGPGGTAASCPARCAGLSRLPSLITAPRRFRVTPEKKFYRPENWAVFTKFFKNWHNEKHTAHRSVPVPQAYPQVLMQSLSTSSDQADMNWLPASSTTPVPFIF